jgi:PncC family amidohydrolase
VALSERLTGSVVTPAAHESAAHESAAAAATLDALVARVHDLLAAQRATLAVAESLTGGLLAAVLTGRPGASTVFRGAVVAYATAVKADLLAVDPGLLADRGAVDPDVVTAMALGVRDRLRASYGVATTGVAGPDEQDGRPVGTVFVAVAGGGGQPVPSVVTAHRFGGDRAAVRLASARAALELLVAFVGD